MLFDLIFPPRKEELLLRSTKKLQYTKVKQRGVEYLHFFKDPVTSAAITENKYYNNTQAQKLLSASLEKWCTEQGGLVIFIPIPLHKQRQHERGHNQVVSVLKRVPEVKIIEGLLVRKKHTKPQTSLSKKDRIKNVKNAFVIKDWRKISNLDNKTVVLVDDVVTTGATMEAARATLAPLLPPSCTLKLLAFAH